MEKLYQTHINLMFHFCWESSTMSSHRLQMQYFCYWSWAEINMHTLWCNVYNVCQFAMLNFPTIMQALKKCSPTLNSYKQTEICKIYNCVTDFVKNLSGEHILFWKTYHSQAFNKYIFCSISQSSPPFSNTDNCLQWLACPHTIQNTTLMFFHRKY